MITYKLFHDAVEKGTTEEEETLSFTFVSDYGDEDVRDSLEELMHDNLLPSTTTLLPECCSSSQVQTIFVL